MKSGAERKQAPHAVVMIRPHHFYPNEQTEADNAFQHKATTGREAIAKAAYDEVGAAVDALRARGVAVHLFDDECKHTPDSVFPNNWFSTHEDGTVALYPMYAPSRRLERRKDIIEELENTYRVRQVLDFSAYEQQNKFLEGTGALVLDHIGKLAYISLSKRANEDLVKKVCSVLGFKPIMFDAVGPDGNAIYHTNVMMNIGARVAFVGADLIRDPAQKDAVLLALNNSGRTVINLSSEQISQFAGNAMELRGRDGVFLVMSTTALSSLSKEQRSAIEEALPILSLKIPTIELAGGSARCMLAGIHLQPK